jgi:hypothetical protein
MSIILRSSALMLPVTGGVVAVPPEPDVGAGVGAGVAVGAGVFVPVVA